MDAPFSELELRFRDVLDTLTDAVFQIDTQKTIRYLSASWTQLTGRCVSEATDVALDQFAWPADRDVLLRVLQPVLNGAPTSMPVELRLARHDGSFCWVEMRLRTLLDADGEIVGAIGSFRDVTERHLSAQRLHQSEALFRAAFDSGLAGVAIYSTDGFFVQTNRRLGDMLGHSPGQLATLDLYALVDTGDVAATKAAVSRASSGHVVDSLPVRCRHHSGESIVCRLSVSPLAQRNGATSLVLLQFAQAAAVPVEGMVAEMPVRASPLTSKQCHDLRSPLNAILGYAEMILDSRPLDGTIAEYARTIERNGRQLLDVIDNLATAPPANEDPTVLTIAPAARLAATPAPLTQRVAGRVLLAEDSKDNQKLMTYLLRRAGVEVDVADDGAVAIERVKQAIDTGRPYDMVVMDVQMPNLDGCAATRALRERGVRVPIIALTAHAMAGDRSRCLAAGCNDYLSKPIDRQALTLILQRYLPQALQTNEGPALTSDSTADILAAPGAHELKGIAEGTGTFETREQLLAALPGLVAAIRRAAESRDLLSLRNAAHQMKQGCARYRMDVLANLAGEAEAVVLLKADSPIIRATLENLVHAVHRTPGVAGRQAKHRHGGPGLSEAA